MHGRVTLAMVACLTPLAGCERPAALKQGYVVKKHAENSIYSIYLRPTVDDNWGWTVRLPKAEWDKLQLGDLYEDPTMKTR